MQAADSSTVKDSTMLNKYPVPVKIPLEYVVFAPSWCRQRELDMVQVEALGIAADCDYGATFNLFLGIVLVVKVADNVPLTEFTGQDLSSFSHLTRQDCDTFFGKNPSTRKLREIIEENRLRFLCLGGNHTTQTARQKLLLHEDLWNNVLGDGLMYNIFFDCDPAVAMRLAVLHNTKDDKHKKVTKLDNLVCIRGVAETYHKSTHFNPDNKAWDAWVESISGRNTLGIEVRSKILNSIGEDAKKKNNYNYRITFCLMPKENWNNFMHAIEEDRKLRFREHYEKIKPKVATELNKEQKKLKKLAKKEQKVFNPMTDSNKKQWIRALTKSRAQKTFTYVADIKTDFIKGLATNITPALQSRALQLLRNGQVSFKGVAEYVKNVSPHVLNLYSKD